MFPFFRAFRPWASVPSESGIQIVVREPGGDFDRTGFLDSVGGLTFTMQKGQPASGQLPLRIAPTVAYAPQVDWPVFFYEVFNGGDLRIRVFAGLISTLDIGFFSNQGDHTIACGLVGLETMFDAIQTPVAEYTAIETGTLLSTLFGMCGTLPVPLTLGTIGAGVAVDRKYDGKTSMLSAFQQLATDSPGYVLYVNPLDLTLNFHDRLDMPAPFDLTDGIAIWGSLKWKQSKANFRDRQIIQMDPNTMPADSATFVGNGVTTAFTLPTQAGSIASAFVTTAVQATAIGSFSGQPLDGDNFTITPTEGPEYFYVFRDAIDNTVFGEIAIGATLADTCANTAAAILGQAGAGTQFSSPTWTNSQVSSESPSGSAFTARAKILGRNGNTVGLSSAGATSPPAFTWSDTVLSSGADNSTKSLTFGPLGAGTYELTFTPGSAAINFATAPATGTTVVVLYRGPQTGMITLQNSAASDLGINSQYQIMFAKGAPTRDAAVQQAAAALTAYSVLPAEFSYEYDNNSSLGFVLPGSQQNVNLTVPLEAPTLLNGSGWTAQQISASLPAPKWELLDDDVPGPHGRPEPGGHFRYNVTLINSAEVQTAQDFWQNLADTGPKDAAVPETPPADVGVKFGDLDGRFLMLKDTTVGVNIADIVPVSMPEDDSTSPPILAVGKGRRIVAVVRISPTADLVVQFRKEGLFASPPTSMSWTITIPALAITGEIVILPIEGDFEDLDEIYVDVLASDGVADRNGIASFVIEWVIPPQ